MMKFTHDNHVHKLLTHPNVPYKWTEALFENSMST